MTQPIRISLVTFVLIMFARSAWADTAADQFNVAADHYRHGRWKLAQAEFQVFVDTYVDHELMVEAEFYLAESLVQQSHFDAARALLEQFIERHTDHKLYRQAVFRLGETNYLSRRYTEADDVLTRFRHLAADDPLNAYAIAYQGDIQLELGNWSAAATLYAEVLNRFPDGPLSDESRHGAARALERSGDRAGAAKIYEHLEGSPRADLADDARLQLARLRYESGQFAASLEQIGRILNRNQDQDWLLEIQVLQARNQIALGHLDDASTTIGDIEPSSDWAARLQFKLAEAFRDADRPDESRASFIALVDRWPASSLADDALHAAIVAASHDSDDELFALVDRLVHEYPSSEFRVEAVELKVRALVRRQDYLGVVASLEPVVPPGETVSPTIGYYLALAYLSLDRPEDASSLLSRTSTEGASPALVNGILVAHAAALVALKKFDASIAPLRAVIASQPDGPDAAHCRAQLVVALAHEGRVDEARVAWTELAQRHDGDVVFLPATLFLAETAYSQGRADLAAQLFTILARSGNPPEFVSRGLSGLAWSQWNSADPVNSAETFYRLVQEFPDSHLATEAAMMRGAALEKAGKHDAALSMYQFVIEQHGDSDRVPAALFSAARAEQRLSRFQRAADFLKQLIDRHGQYERIDAAYYQYAWLLVDLGKPEEADVVFDTIRERYPRSAYWSDAVYRLAERAARAGNHDIADRLAEELIRANDDPKIVAYALYLRGQLAASADQWPQVESLMADMIDRFPGSTMRVAANYWLAEATYRQEKYDEAGQRFEQLERETGGRSEPWLGMVPLRRAQVHAHQGQWERVREIASSIAEQFPDFGQQHEVDYLLGRYFTSQADFVQARKAYQRVIESPTGTATETAAMAQWMTGETYMMQKDYGSALRAYYRVTSLYSFPRWQSAALLQAGKCHEAQGEWREAIKLYSSLLEKHAETMFADEAERRLRVARQRATIAAID